MCKSPEKKCADCGKTVHVRKRECSCGFVFPYKERKKKVEEDYSPQDIDYVYDSQEEVATGAGAKLRKHRNYSQIARVWPNV